MTLYVVLTIRGSLQGVFSSTDMARSFIARHPFDEQWRFEIKVVTLDSEA